ncbi:MAG: MFS transporter [Anaerolineales bacterium]|jgi:MFS family permease
MMIRSQNPDKISLKITLLAASVMTILGGAFLAPTLPAIRSNFSDLANVDYLTRLVLTLPAFFIAVNAPLAGYIVDRFGRTRVLVSSLVLAGLAGGSGYIAPTLTTLLVGRGLVGIAVAGIMTSATTLIADYYAGEQRAKLLGLQTGFLGIGGTIFITLTGFLADLNWRAPFLIHLVALAVLPLVLVFLYEPRREFRCADNPPTVGEPGTCAGESIQMESGTPVTTSEDEPAPVRLIAFIYAVILLVEIVFYIIPLQLPFYLQELTGATAAQSGMAISIFALSFALASIFLGKTMARRDHITVLMLSFILIGLGFSMISLAGESPVLYLGLATAGSGVGILIPNMYVWLASETPNAIRGRILGGFTTALFLGQFLSPVLSQPLIGVYDIGRTILIAGGFLVVLVPFVFAGRGRLKKLAAEPA